jgi:hypothetical protein
LELLVAEDLHGIDAGGANGREDARGSGDDEDQENDCGKSGDVGRGDAIEKASEKTSGSSGQREAGHAA